MKIILTLLFFFPTLSLAQTTQDSILLKDVPYYMESYLCKKGDDKATIVLELYPSSCKSYTNVKEGSEDGISYRPVVVEPDNAALTRDTINICEANVSKDMTNYFEKGYTCSLEWAQQLENTNLNEDLTIKVEAEKLFSISYLCKVDEITKADEVIEADEVTLTLEIYPKYCKTYKNGRRSGMRYTSSGAKLSEDSIEACKADFMEEDIKEFMKEGYTCSLSSPQ